MKKIIEVTGMHCGHCAKSVEKSLLEIEGVKKAKADNEKNHAVISCSSEVSDASIRTAVEKAGFIPGKIETKKGLFD